MHAEFNNGSAVSRDITRHFSAPFGSETTLGCTRQLTGRLSNARIATPPPDERLVEFKHIAKSPQPGERASCSAWAICLGSAGRLHVTRQSLFGERAAQCQESSNRATRKASINHADRTWECHYLVCRCRVGGYTTCHSIKQRDGGSSRFSVALR